jgi:nucleotide-binding universal stress UspA family protein
MAEHAVEQTAGYPLVLNPGAILFPLGMADTSPEHSPHLVRQVAWLARSFHSGIVLLHVVTSLDGTAGLLEFGPDLHARVFRRARESIDRTLWPQFEGIAVTREVIEGNPAEQIVNLVRGGKIGLIAMANRGHGAIYRFLLGSVTAKVLHETPCPVWTGAHLEEDNRPDFSIRRILCAVELTGHSVRTVSLAAGMAAALGATLTLVHVTDGVEFWGPGGKQVDLKWKATVTGAARLGIARLQRDAGTNAEVIIESGSTSPALTRAAEQVQADVLVVGHIPGHSHLGDNGEGYAVIRESRIPVLSV